MSAQEFPLVLPVNLNLAQILARYQGLPPAAEVAELPFELQEKLRADIRVHIAWQQLSIASQTAWECDLRVERQQKAFRQYMAAMQRRSESK